MIDYRFTPVTPVGEALEGMWGMPTKPVYSFLLRIVK